VKEARRRGVLVRRLDSIRSCSSASVATSGASGQWFAVDIAQNSEETKRVLGHIGLPVPGSDVVRTVEGAELDAKAG
jgi:hypothetical protein